MEHIEISEVSDSSTGSETFDKLEDFQMKLIRCIRLASNQRLKALIIDKNQFINHLIVLNIHTGDSPLHVAIFENNSMAVKMLIKHGANVNVKDKNGDTPLEYLIEITNAFSVTQINTNIFKYLLLAGATFCATSSFPAKIPKTTPSILSALSSLSNAMDSNSSNSELSGSPMRTLINKGLNKFIRILIRMNINCKKNTNQIIDEIRDVEGNSIIHLIVMYCPPTIDVEACADLHKVFQSYVNLDSTNMHDQTPLEFAIQIQKFQLVKMLLMYDVTLRYDNPVISSFFLNLCVTPNISKNTDMIVYFIYHLVKRYPTKIEDFKIHPVYWNAYRYFKELNSMSEHMIGESNVTCLRLLLADQNDLFELLEYIELGNKQNLAVFLNPKKFKFLFPMFYPILKWKYTLAITNLFTFKVRRLYINSKIPENCRLPLNIHRKIVSLWSNEWKTSIYAM